LEEEAQFIGNFQTGHNHLEDNGSHLHLLGSQRPLIKNGNNKFGWAGSSCIQGSVQDATIQELTQEWAGNEWDNSGTNIALEWADAATGEYGYSTNWSVLPQIPFHSCGEIPEEEPMAGFIKSATVEINCWPNPGSAVLHVVLPKDQQVQLQIRDAQGRLVYEGSLQNSLDISTQDWSAGMYHLIFDGDDIHNREIWVKQ
jgi:hypothetical protein